MKVFQKIILMVFVFSIAVALSGCQGKSASRKRDIKYFVPEIEAQWIRDGNPIEFEDELWYPRDNVDILLDEEVYRIAEYRGVEVFADKVDVRPYDQLYTKFGKNKFRSFKKKNND